MTDYTAMQEKFDKKAADNQDRESKMRAEIHRKLVGRAQKVKSRCLTVCRRWGAGDRCDSDQI